MRSNRGRMHYNAASLKSIYDRLKRILGDIKKRAEKLKAK